MLSNRANLSSDEDVLLLDYSSERRRDGAWIGVVLARASEGVLSIGETSPSSVDLYKNTKDLEISLMIRKQRRVEETHTRPVGC